MPTVRAALVVSLGVSLAAHVAAAALTWLTWHTPSSADPAPLLAGETFELPAPPTTALASIPTSPLPVTTSATAPADASGSREEAATPSRGHRAPAAPHVARSPLASGHADPDVSGGASTTALLFGAVGDRSAADLRAAFTRGFPQAASADPLWQTAPFGSAGEADVLIVLDASGHIERSTILGTPSPALASALGRTLALVKGRPFVAKGRTTTLHFAARVTSDDVHDGLHGDVFAIGGSFAGDEGHAFFALSIGRRIDVRIRAK